MGEIIKLDQLTVDLGQPLSRSNAGRVLATGDSMANRFAAKVVKNGKPVDLVGCHVTAYFIQPNKNTLFFTGNIIENIAYVDLPDACYEREGRFNLAIKVAGADFTHTLRIIDGWIVNTRSGTVTDPGDEVPTLDEVIALISDLRAFDDVKLDSNLGFSNAGKVLYVSADGSVQPLGLGAGLQIVNGTLVVTGSTGGGTDTSQMFYTADGSVFCTADDAIFYVTGG